MPYQTDEKKEQRRQLSSHAALVDPDIDRKEDLSDILNKVVDSDRLAALHRTLLLGTAPEASFDRFTRLTAKMLRTPVALVSLVDADHQFFKSCFGLPEPWSTKQRTPLTHSFCQHVVATQAPFVVNDSRINPLVCDNLAVADLGVIAYLGFPLSISDGQVIGALCAIDSRPREWTDSEIEVIGDLAALVAAEIDSREVSRTAVAAQAALDRVEEQREFDEKLGFLADSVPAIIWTAKPDGSLNYYNRRWFEYSGLTFEQTKDWGWKPVLHPEDLQNCLEHWTRALATGESYEIECRLKRASDGEYRWHQARAVPRRNPAGAIVQWVGTTTDIHDQKVFAAHLEFAAFQLEARVEQRTAEIIAAEARFRVIFESSAGAHFLLQDGRVLDCNSAAVALLGCQNKAELLSRHPAEFSPEFQPNGRRSAETRRQIDALVIETGFQRFDWTLQKTDGTEVFVEVCLTSVKLNGKDAIISVCHDLTQRRNAERAVARASRFAESIADHSSCSIYIRQLADEKFAYMNRETREFIGCKPGDITEGSTEFNRQFFHPDDLHKVISARRSVNDLADGQVVQYMARSRRGDGEWRLLLHRQVVFQRDGDGRPTQILGAAQDITDLMKAQEDLRVAKERAEKHYAALQQSEERFQAFMDNSPAVCFIKDEQSRLLYVNRRFESMFNRSSAELLGKRDCDFLPEKIARETMANDRLVLAEGMPTELIEHVPLPDGQMRHWMSFKFPLEALDGKGLVGGIALDITARMNAESELKQAQCQALAAKDAADTASQAKSDFLANMSHEIRTPIAAIIGFADLMAGQNQSQEDLSDCLQTIRRNARHLLELINDILDLSKIEAGKMTFEKTACDVPRLVADVMSTMRPRAKEKGLAFNMSFTGKVPRIIQTDSLKLRQILVNLIGNAIKFTEKGTVVLEVHFDSAGGSNALHFAVRDTGIGLTPNQLSRLFQSFTQADESTTRRFGGTGLGLTISRRLARLLGGDISVISQSAIGSTFTLSIQCGVVTTTEMISGLTEAGLPGTPLPVLSSDIRLNCRILLAEDGLDNQRLLTTHLRAAGAHVAVAENGRIAVDMAMAQTFDVILMDMQMPEMDGYTAAAELRRRGSTLPIIALTAHAMAEDRARCLDSGCTEYLTKPIDKVTLLQTIASTIQQHSRSSPVPRPTIENAMADMPEMQAIIADYVNGLPETLKVLETLLNQNDLQPLCRVVHQLRGSGGGYGFDCISEFAGTAEDAMIANEVKESITEKVNALIDVIRQVEGFNEARNSNGRLPINKSGFAVNPALP